MPDKSFEPNPTHLLNALVYDDEIKWVTQTTAILVVHGIGNQLPLETIDQLGRGLIKAYKKKFGDDIILSHHLATKDDGQEGFWMDNVLRISKKDNAFFIDIYEYYWAHYTEDKASWGELNTWLHGVVNGAKSFYKRNATIGQHYKDSSPFFDSKTGKFNATNYRFFISAASKLILTINLIYRGLLWVVSRIPFFGRLAESMMKSYSEGIIKKFTNVVGDVVVYNVVDPKSKFYDTRRKILDGAVKALQFLIERLKVESPSVPPNDQTQYYPSVIVAGHSLGSQVAYDAINRLNLLINQQKIKNYDADGNCLLQSRNGKKIKDQLTGFITFGSPLDKIIFFLRENVPDNEYVRQQFLAHFHGFKQRDLNFTNNSNTNKDFVQINHSLTRHLEKITWRNYFDNTDYVSGGLDYYEHLTNIDCQFKAGKFGFTHSYYWESDNFYKDVIMHFLK